MIKLLKISEMKDGTIRLQSQLYIGKNTADFIIEDNILKCWGYGDKGSNWYEYNKPYQIVENKEDMLTQPLQKFYK